MPFVVCKSNGGQYEDESFVAGLMLGEMMTNLGQFPRKPKYSQQVVVGLLPMADLLAMRYGYEMIHVHDNDEWITVWFERLDSDG